VDRYTTTGPNVQHNNSTYNKGCRCDTCREAHTQYRRDARARAATRPPASHGESGYRNSGCRCEVCRKANTETIRAARAALAKKEPRAHNASTYQNYGCRCGVCREAVRVARARYRKSARARQRPGG
jgi:hypothetical protein